MSFPKYPKYKASGVEWLGDVPAGWGVWKLTHAFEKIGSGTTPKTDNREYYDEGTHPWVNTGDLNDNCLSDCEKKITDLALRDHTTLRVYPSGSVVIAMYGATIGKLAILQFPASVNQACCVFSGKLKIEYKFLFFWLFGFRQQIISLASGGGQPNVNQDILRGLRVACPDLAEQAIIAAFLDRETAKIDGLVAEQKRLMELLKEKRQAVISHAVTKGLNPHAPMKPSGVEWLGDVPEHWEVKRLRFVANLNPSKSEIASLDRGTAVSFLPMEAVGDDGTLTLDKEKTIGELEAGYTYFRDGDVTIAKITPCYENKKGALMCGLKNGIGFGTTELIVARPLPTQITGLYLHYLFISPDFRSIGESYMYGAGGQKRVPDAFVRNFETAIPPLTEQKAIAAHLTTELSKFDTLTTEAQRAIDLLQERRTALISAAVTGQIDVRKININQGV